MPAGQVAVDFATFFEEKSASFEDIEISLHDVFVHDPDCEDKADNRCGRSITRRSRSPFLNPCATPLAQHKRSPSPKRGLSPLRVITPTCSDTMVGGAVKSSARFGLVVLGGLVTFATAATTMPKLTRISVDTDYSHLMNHKSLSNMVLQASGHSEVALQFEALIKSSEAEARLLEDYGFDETTVRLRGGLSPSLCTSSLGKGAKATFVRSSGQALKPPKLSRTVDDRVARAPSRSRASSTPGALPAFVASDIASMSGTPDIASVIFSHPFDSLLKK